MSCMASPLAVFDVKPVQLRSRTADRESVELDLTFNLELEHRVWLLTCRVDRRRPETDPARLDWDGYQSELCLPEAWQPSLLATEGQFGGSWPLGQLRPDGAVEHPTLCWGPMPGDRVVVVRSAPQTDVVGVWLITGARFGHGGAVRYSHRPLVSCLEPVPLRAALRHDADLAHCWDTYFARSSRSRGRFVPLEGAGLSAVMRTVGIDPRWLCGPAGLLPDCSMSNVRPDHSYRPATRLRTTLSSEARAEERAVAEAVDWLLGPPSLGAVDDRGDVEIVASSGRGTSMVARRRDEVHEVVALGLVSTSLDDIELCPTVVFEAHDAAASGRNWSLMVTLDALGTGRTIGFSARAVAACFDPVSGRSGLTGT